MYDDEELSRWCCGRYNKNGNATGCMQEFPRSGFPRNISAKSKCSAIYVFDRAESLGS